MGCSSNQASETSSLSDSTETGLCVNLDPFRNVSYLSLDGDDRLGTDKFKVYTDYATFSSEQENLNEQWSTSVSSSDFDDGNGVAYLECFLSSGSFYLSGFYMEGYITQNEQFYFVFSLQYEPGSAFTDDVATPVFFPKLTKKAIEDYSFFCFTCYNRYDNSPWEYSI